MPGETKALLASGGGKNRLASMKILLQYTIGTWAKYKYQATSIRTVDCS